MADITAQPIVVTHEGGARFGAQIRSHRVVVDQPERAGGADSGPMPLELHKASSPNRVGLFAARVILPAPLPAAYVELVERVARSCPAHGTLTHAAQVLVTVEPTVAAAA